MGGRAGLGEPTKSSNFSGRGAWGGGWGKAGGEAGLAFPLELPLWVSACLEAPEILWERALLYGVGLGGVENELEHSPTGTE